MLKRVLLIVALGASLIACTPANPATNAPSSVTPTEVTPSEAAPSESMPTESMPTESASPAAS
jgi:hypothetical protein